MEIKFKEVDIEEEMFHMLPEEREKEFVCNLFGRDLHIRVKSRYCESLPKDRLLLLLKGEVVKNITVGWEQ